MRIEDGVWLADGKVYYAYDGILLPTIYDLLESYGLAPEDFGENTWEECDYERLFCHVPVNRINDTKSARKKLEKQEMLSLLAETLADSEFEIDFEDDGIVIASNKGLVNLCELFRGRYACLYMPFTDSQIRMIYSFVFSDLNNFTDLYESVFGKVYWKET